MNSEEKNEAIKTIKSAIDANRTDIVKSLLDAVKSKDPQYVSELLAGLNTEHGTFLHYVTQVEQADMVRVLLNSGANPCIPNESGLLAPALATLPQTKAAYHDAVFSAIAQHEEETLKKLLEADVSVHIHDSVQNSNSPVHWAVSFKNTEAIRLLYEHGADVNETNTGGLTPLHEAVLHGDRPLVETLLYYGADPSRKCGKGKYAGKTCLDLVTFESPIWSLLNYQKTQLSPSIVSLSSDSKEQASVHYLANGRNTLLGAHLNHNGESLESPGTESVFSLDQMAEMLPTSLPPSPIKPVITNTKLALLWPQPQSLQQLNEAPLRLGEELLIHCIGCELPIHAVLDIWDCHKVAFRNLDLDVRIGNIDQLGALQQPNVEETVIVMCCVKRNLFAKPSSYRLIVRNNKIQVSAADLPGLHYALCTLRQLIALFKSENSILALIVSDVPQVSSRATLLDVSVSGRVPTLESLLAMVDVLGFLKVNQVHLFARIGVDMDWPWGYSKSELLALDRFCCDRFIQLVPALDIEPSLGNVRDYWPAISSTLSTFSSAEFLNVGPQLTNVLLSQDMLDFRQLLPLTSKTLLLCANSARERGVLFKMPPDVVLVEYGFQADYNFHEQSESSWQSTGNVTMCAGTAAWDSLAGYPEAALCNLVQAINATKERGLGGIIGATWSGAVNLTQPCFAWPGYVVLAGIAWNSTLHWDYLQNFLGDLVSTWVFNEPEPILGPGIVELGRMETAFLKQVHFDPVTQTGVQVPLPMPGGSTLYRFLIDPDNVVLDNITMEALMKVIRHVKKWQKAVMECSSDSAIRGRYLSEFLLASDFVLLACRIGRMLISSGRNPHSNLGLCVINVGVANAPATLRTDAANRFLSLTERFRALWLKHQLPSGIKTSLSTLELATARFLTSTE